MLFTFGCFSATYASTNSTGEKKSKEEVTSGNELDDSEEAPVQEKPKEDSGYMPAKPDSTSNFNTSCKFNFIFYFIYKMKYDDDTEMESKLNYPL